jgi:hypothetical protein
VSTYARVGAKFELTIIGKSTADEIAAEQWPAYCHERGIALERAGATILTPAFKPAAIIRRSFPIAIIVAGLAVGRLHNIETNRTINTAGGVEHAASLALEHVKRGKFTDAYKLAAAIRSNYRNNFDMQLVFAEAAIRTGHFAEADEALAKVHSLRAGDPLPDLLQVTLYEARGEFIPARDLLNRLAAQPGAPDRVFTDLARLSERLGDSAGARRAW